MILIAIASLLLLCAGVPAIVFAVNLRRYRAPLDGPTEVASVSVLIPARNEESNIRDCLRCILASRDVDLQVLVLDDGSTDRTAEIVRAINLSDARVRLATAHPLPPGWNGKQHACWCLAQEGTQPLLSFVDADVRLEPDALSRCIAQIQHTNVALLSGFPRQITVGWMEQMLLPLIHFILLGFLPIGRMRNTTNAAYAAGCGQFFLASRTAYLASGGHEAIRETRHDGLRLPRSFRLHGFRTDIVDLTELASVRMYDSPRAVWMGLAKNATEGLGAPSRIVPLTLLLLLGQVLPLILLGAWLAFCMSNAIIGATFDDIGMAWAVSTMLVLAAGASYLPRLLAVRRFKQPLRSALLHPLGVSMLLVVQWYALARQVFGAPVEWRARAYSSGTGEEISETHADSGS
jgi:glycosyltransferase involved in cell wall biosynthesis